MEKNREEYVESSVQVHKRVQAELRIPTVSHHKL